MTMFYGIASTIAVIWVSILVGKSKGRQRSKAGKWFEKGMKDLRGPAFIMGIFALEFAIFIGTLVPYFRYGCHKEIMDYALFSLPCAAGLAAGAGLFFQPDFSADANVKAFVVSGLLLFVGYLVAIYPAKFYGEIWFWNILLIVSASLVGLSILLFYKNYDDHPLEGLVFPIIIGLGGVILIAGLAFYFTAPPLASTGSGKKCDYHENAQNSAGPKQACCPS